MVFSNENIHNGSGFILGANEYSEPDLTPELAEGGAKHRQGKIRSSVREPKNEARQSLRCSAVFAAAV